jgi:hypothetical protein
MASKVPIQYAGAICHLINQAVWAVRSRCIPLKAAQRGRLPFKLIAFWVAVLAVPLAGVCEPAQAEHTARLDTSLLQAVLADNEPYGTQHQPGYNGVAELRLKSGDQRNLFVPLFAGLNFEHIFSGDSASYGWHIFEPRRAPMQLIRASTNRIELLQERTDHWPLRSRLVYEFHQDSIDFTYCGTPLADVWKAHGYVGVFFASYINAPEDLALQFIGRSRPGRGDARPRWIKHVPPGHGAAASHRPAGSDWEPPFDPGFPLGLVSGISAFEYVYPFYYGRYGEQVFIMMFENQGKGSELRFAHSPSGAGHGNPAWDFFYMQRDYAVNREFRVRARAVYGKFRGVEDVVRIYETWSGQKVELPPTR